MIKIKESVIQAQIIQYLLYLENQGKLFIQRTNNVGLYDQKNRGYRRTPIGQKKGFPDILVLHKGKFIGIEIKTKTGKQTEHQKKMQKMIEKNGGEYYVIRSLNELIEKVKLK